MIRYKALILDMDGLMVDTEKLYWKSEYQVAREAGVELSKDTIYKMMGRKPLEAMGIFCEDLGLTGRVQDWLDKRDGIMLELMQGELSALPGLYEILERFKDELKLAIATSAHGVFLDLVVDKLAIRDEFDLLLCSDTISHGKPHPEIYLKAVELLQLEPEQCIVLEDTENGSRSAWSAGCLTIAIPSEYTREQDFSMAHYIAKDLTDAREYIKAKLREK